MIRFSRGSAGLLAVALAVLAFQASPSAHHRWKRYHWARTQNPLNLTLGRNLSTAWQNYLQAASSDWSSSNVLNTTVGSGDTTGATCDPTLGKVEVCNASYGATGWLGVARIWITTGTHIAQGTVKVNDYYFNQSQYNSAAWRQFVMCQEVGHEFGLDHQDENFNNTNLGTCMDYTSDPDGTVIGQFSNLHPNVHDYEERDIMYAHLDSFNTASPAKTPSLNDPSEWGQLMKTAHGGKTQIFERNFGNGEIVVTFVIWA